MTHHKADAEDLVQEACLKLFRRYGKLASRPLLFVAIRHLFIDRIRQPDRFVSEDQAPSSELPAPAPSENGAMGDLHILLGRLRPAEREALYLHHVEGYTAQEIADLTQTPRNTVLSLLSRSLRKLQAAGINAS